MGKGGGGSAPAAPDPVAQRFWAKVRKGGDNECWEWTACTQLFGYGIFRGADGKAIRAHRLSWQMSNGQIPPGLCVCHHCDNPRCVNPSHLFLGTHNDNRQDCVRKGRGSYGLGLGRVKLSPPQVIEIKRELKKGVMGKELAMRYNVSNQTISAINRGHQWPNVEVA